ncbi:MAG: 3-hydroxyacyl-[acyl-carrier-protein] dehydratase FabA, partial [Bacteroidetes bacterium]
MKSKIAIIGMSALFPESHTPEQFWQNLLAQKDVTTTSTTQDFGAAPTLFFDTAKGKIDKCYSLKGGYIRDFNFNSKGYAVDKELLESVDEIFQWSLYVAAEALKDAGYFQNYDILQKCGIILGNLSFPTRSTHQISSAMYQNIFEKHLQQKLGLPNFKLPASRIKSDPFYIPKWSSSPTNLVSQALNLGGNHFALDAACATSLYAIKLACDQLISGKSDLMLAGAVSCADPLFIHMGFSIFQAYSESGKASSPFDKQTGGLISSEGAGMLVLKRYEDALADGDQIHAVISGIGLSNDGKGKFLLVPNPKGQILAFERAYQDSQIKPTDVQYIECHATGTPLGDITEINSIADFFDNANELPVGSVKSNIGHLLTAAGITSMVKVILSMKNNLIPATIKITEPIISHDQRISGKNIVQKPLSWKNNHKVAAINSFGFGGTNAHLVLESAEKQLFNQEKIKFEPLPMAIIGMDCHFGNCKNLEEFYLTIYEGKQQFIDLPEKRWKGMEINDLSRDFDIPNFDLPKGAYITDFEIDLLRFKIQPKEAEKLEPQQTLILKVAENALKNAGFDKIHKNNVAVIVAMETEMAIHHYLERWDLGWQIKEAVRNANLELNEKDLDLLENTCKNLMYPSSQAENSASQHTSFIGNVMTARISSLWDFTGASFTISSGENSVLKALEVAQNLLSFGEVDAVVVGAVDLSGSFENVMLKAKDNPITQKQTLSFEKNGQGWAVGEGAGVVILKRLEEAKQDKDRIFAVINDIKISQKPFKVETKNIDYLELSASGLLGENELEMQMFEQSTNRNCAVGSVKANIGHTFAAAGMASLIKTALCLFHRFIPAIPQWKMPLNPDFFAKTPFYFPVESRPWILENHQEKRNAAIQNLASDGSFGLINMTEFLPDVKESEQLLLKVSHEKLYLIQANSEEEMTVNLHLFAQKLATISLENLANQTFQNFKESAYTLCLIAKDMVSLKQEIAFAEKGISQSFQTGKAFQSPQGSYFESKPLGKDAKIALVYPGAASAYVGLGKDLFQLFPTLLEEFTPIVPDVSDVLRSKQLFPRHQSVIEGRGLRFDPISQMSIGSSFSALYTKIIQDHLQ